MILELKERQQIAQTLVSPLENQAYTYLRATVNQTVAEKNYATVNATMLNVREGKGTESRIVGTMNQGALCYVLADADSDWYMWSPQMCVDLWQDNI